MEKKLEKIIKGNGKNGDCYVYRSMPTEIESVHTASSDTEYWRYNISKYYRRYGSRVNPLC